MPSPPETTRRGFLALAGSGAALAALGRLGPAPALAAPGARFFSERERELLALVVERMVASDDPAAPALGETDALETIERLCAGLDPEIARPLPALLRLFDWAPLLFDFTFTRFSRMTPEQRDASLHAWMTSRLGLRRKAFYALRNLSFLGWWSQEETWPLAGYAGPLLREAPPA